MTSKRREWVRTFEINILHPQTGKSSLFSVTSLLFPVGFPEAATRLVVKKRYSDFQSLHKSLSEIHKNLYLRGKFPDLPKVSKSYFKKIESSTDTEEHRTKCLNLLEFCAEHPQLCNNRIFTSFFTDMDSPKSEIDSPKTEFEISNKVFEPDRAIVDRSPAKETSDIIHRLSKDGNILDAAVISTDLAPDPTPSLKPFQLNNQIPKDEVDSLPTPDEDMPEYLSDAANLISMAIQYESEENFSESVACYRNAIGTLLKSVARDNCLKRQASVKRRISQYINKAEKLIEQDNQKKSNDEQTSVSVMKSANSMPHLELFGNIRDLRKFRIEAVLANKVILVSEQHKEHQQVVIKALQKSSLVFKTRKTSMLPVNIPFMVKLVRYFETDELIYLVLEYVPYGPLMPIVKPFLDRQIEKDGLSTLDEDTKSSQDVSFHNSSVIRPSPSFIQIRRKSIQPDVDQSMLQNHRRSLSMNENVDVDVDVKDSKEYYRTYSLETDETSSIEDFNFVYMQEEENQSNILCVDKLGIEKIDCSKTELGGKEKKLSESTEDRISTGFNAIDSPKISIKISCENDTTDSGKIHSPEDLVKEAETLLSSLALDLQQTKDLKAGEAVLQEAEIIEKNVYLHLDGRALTPSPSRSFRAASGSPVSPPSTSSVASSIPPIYADEQSPTAEIVLSDLISAIDGIDLLSQESLLPMELIRRWTTQLCHVIMSLHSRGIIVQDLHPSNILLGRDLQLRLTYQCEWVSVDKPVNWYAIENLYSAPEVADVGPMTPACDWWSVGAILYELLTGQKLVEIHPSGLPSHISLHFPDSRRSGREKEVETEMRNFVTALLQPVPGSRLGAGSTGANDIRSHSFFKHVNWSLT